MRPDETTSSAKASSFVACAGLKPLRPRASCARAAEASGPFENPSPALLRVSMKLLRNTHPTTSSRVDMAAGEAVRTAVISRASPDLLPAGTKEPGYGYSPAPTAIKAHSTLSVVTQVITLCLPSLWRRCGYPWRRQGAAAPYRALSVRQRTSRNWRRITRRQPLTVCGPITPESPRCGRDRWGP